ncbi:WSC domain-containing protein [Cladorrhinum sp. PSN332]|nr:WSC domain-containing protein [Cladorrhinum sp. PSN332]
MWTHALIGLTSVGLSGVHASPLSSSLTTRAVPQIPGYNYTGCYTEANGVRALNGSSYFDDQMTVQKCASACTGFKYFALEYGRECFCGNTINTGSVPAPAEDCSFTCPGDPTQDCGAGNRLNLYTRSAPPPSFTSYGYRGCFSEPTGARALPNLYQRSATNMTIQGCAAFCSAGGYTLFGLEYYEECFCGQTLTSGTLPAPETNCRFPCTGDSQQTCGGDSHLSLYEFGFTSTPGSYLSEGCYTEAQGIRALSDFAYYNDNMTVALCANACTGYNFFGLEYGRECFCGNSINTANGSAPTAISECSFQCPGNPAERCGAGNRLNLYRYLPAAPSTTVSSSPASTSTPLSTSSSTTLSLTTYVLPSLTSTTTSTTTSSSSTDSSSVSSTSTSSSIITTVTSTSSSSTSSSPTPTSTSSSTSSSSTSSSSSLSFSSSSSVSSSASSSSITSSLFSFSSSSSVTPTLSSSIPSSTSSSTSSSSSSSTSSTPVPSNVLTNSDFESTGSWTIRANSSRITYSFVNTNGPHGGSRAASIAYSAGVIPPQAWFSQAITLRAGTRYNFAGWTRASVTNPGCSVAYFIGSADGNSVLKTLANPASANIRTNWGQATGFYDTPPGGEGTAVYTFNVRTNCASMALSTRTYFVDDLSLVAAA